MIAEQGGPVEAAGYIRVSQRIQAQGLSPTEQRDKVKQLAKEQGYLLTMLEEDHERGGKITRTGYQRIIAAVRDGRIHAVLVNMFDRWGRDAPEWLTVAREFDRLGVPIISAQEGRDEGGLMRCLRAGMAEEESVKIAKRVRPIMERTARNGTHTGPAPFGYALFYPEHIGGTRRAAGRLIPDPATAWIVDELYARYEAGNTSLRDLALWMNTDPRIPPPRRAGAWTISALTHMFHCATYRGAIEYNKHPTGRYQRAAPDSRFVLEDQHPALVSPQRWQRVVSMLDDAASHSSANRTRSAHGRPTALLAGLLVCAQCGRPMFADMAPVKYSYGCSGRRDGTGCRERHIRIDKADAAVLAVLRRLRTKPWTVGGEARLINGHRADAVVLAKALETEKEQLRRQTRLMTLLDDPTPEQIAACRATSVEISARIRAIEAQLADDTARIAHVPTIRDVHKQLRAMPLAALIDAAETPDERAELRPVVRLLIRDARIVERSPGHFLAWAKADVTWTDEIAVLLADGELMRLDLA